MFYRYEVRTDPDKPWEGGFQRLFPDQRRYIGRFLKEPKWYKKHPDVETRCWFTQEGFDKYGGLVREAIEKRGVEYRLINWKTLSCWERSSVYKGSICMTSRSLWK